jgi:hypothetical protein
MRFDDVWRLSTAQALAVASVGGAAASTPLSAHRPMRFSCPIRVRPRRPVAAGLQSCGEVSKALGGGLALSADVPAVRGLFFNVR